MTNPLVVGERVGFAANGRESLHSSPQGLLVLPAFFDEGFV
jgi:hypothetical protein